MNTLMTLVQEKIQNDQISLRESARQVGVSATTMSRIRDGEIVDMSTILKVCEWLGVNPSEVLNSETGDLSARLAAVLESYPTLAKVFEEILDKALAGEIPTETVYDILAYATFRISLGTKQKNSLVGRQTAIPDRLQF